MGAKSWLVGALVVAGGAWFVLRSDDPVPPSSALESRQGADALGESGKALPLERHELVVDGPEAASPPADAPPDEPRVHLSGRILSRADHRPIVGAQVTVWHTQFFSDASGRYEAAFPWRQEMMEVRVAAAGFESSWAPLVVHEPGAAHLDVELSPLRRLTIQVVDRTTGAPIAGAEVRRFARGLPEAREERLHSDAQGMVVIEVPGRGVLEVEAAEHVTIQWVWTLGPDPPPVMRLTMLGVAWVEGTVRDTDGSAVAGAGITHAQAIEDRLVGADLSALPGLLVDRGLRATTKVAPDGSFQFAVRPGPEQQVLVANASGCAACTSGAFVLASPGERRRVDLVLTKGGDVLGVVRRNGEPASGTIHWQVGEARGQGSTGSLGFYWLRNVPPGLAELRLQCGDTVVKAQTVTVAAGRETHCDFGWQETVARLAGRLTNARGEPVAGARITASEEVANGHTGGGKTDAEGRFAFEFRGTGTCSVWTEHDRLKVVQRGVASDAQDVALVVPDVCQVRLVLRDAERREPLPGHGPVGNMILWRRVGDVAFTPASALLDMHGVATVVLPRGVVDVRIVAQRLGFVPQLLSGLVIGSTTADVPVWLSRGASLHLHVRGETPFLMALVRHQLFLLEDSQVPAVHGPVSALAYLSHGLGSDIDPLCTDLGILQQTPSFDPDGRATVAGLVPGRYRLVVFPDDLVFEPATFEVGSEGADVKLHWRRR